MGAWGTKVLENDYALDTMYELENMSPKEARNWAINQLHAKWDIYNVLLAVSIVDISFNKLDKNLFGGTSNYEKWLNALYLKGAKYSDEYSNEDIVKLAIDGINMIRERDKKYPWFYEEDRIARNKMFNEYEKRLKGVLK